ncbi:transcription-repair coupling factor [Thermaurantiacus sp.]
MRASFEPIAELQRARAPLTVSGLPAGLLPWAMADLARAAHADGGRAVLIAADEAAARAVAEAANLFAPELDVHIFPAWDCLPYDRASPSHVVVAERLATLAALLSPPARPQLLATTVAAATQRLLGRDIVRDHVRTITVGEQLPVESLVCDLQRLGYVRVDTAADQGEFAVRGGLLDVMPPGCELVFRLDFFGDEVEAIREVDPASQRTTGKRGAITLLPVSEVLLDPERIRRFRRGWLEQFGATAATDPLYQAISEGRRSASADHFLPLFEERLETLFDWLGPADLVLADSASASAASQRFEAIADYHGNRVSALAQPGRSLGMAAVYRPLPPEALYLTADEWAKHLGAQPVHLASPFPGGPLDLGGLPARDFAADRVAAEAAGTSLYAAVAARLARARAEGVQVIVSAFSDGSRDRLAGLLAEAGVPAVQPVASWQEALGAAASAALPLMVLPLAHGFQRTMADGSRLELWTEADMLGDRLVPRRRRARAADAFVKELQVLSAGELVVHKDHGIGRYLGLQTITAAGSPHDTVALEYAGGDRLYVPVENLDVLSRYGSESEGVALDRLGGTGWAQRKARMKDRIREIAQDLLRVAAARATRPADVITPDSSAYTAFVDRFPWPETDDQLRATADVLEDLGRGRPMDRLICGDVGFGKTEVALRAAFAAAISGVQVAVICPTTLLARQHAETFRERFRGFPLKVGQLSRLVGAAEAKATREGLADGTVDVVVGTHALLAKSVRFRRLGLVIVDEEQRFGVTHKERLKALRHDVHVLTLTATPIPRTLQMALSGLRELSVIATPPVDRLAVRTTVGPFDPVVLREALLREHHRGGQSFIVVPRIADIPDLEALLCQTVPEVRFVTAHGQMAASEIEERMTAFYEHRYDVLLATTIVESGLDIPNANTLIVCRADMFGLAQLYQLRGRVGRAKRRAYALLMTSPEGTITAAAEKRLQVLASLDSLGAGFELASHDLDQRGAGNLLGDEQSGHIREVGFELYQSMLEDAIVAAKAEASGLKPPDDPLSPTITTDAPVMIPESYVPDLAVRMALYRRAADLADPAAIEAFAAELIDRFGKLPPETANLLKAVEAKQVARQAGILKLEAGPKGLLVSFAPSGFPAPDRLVRWIEAQKGAARLRPDQKLFLARDLATPGQRLGGALALARALAKLADAPAKPPVAPPAPGPRKMAVGSYRARK